ncbi:MAG: 2,3-bisphosphoglycerate-independent phosphoglycerate mutase, partial [Armatimonadetes bacterium]|nr:2,3-bisphosphoglycerate-independent phosphoglycerate mutase [Armatimonadota bacterium]
LHCQGESVGLRHGLMGNSEVGHENLGAGRIVVQEILFIDRAIDDGSFFAKPALVEAVRHAKQTGGRLHLSGLTSEGGVHSSEKHYFALLRMAKEAGLTREQVLFHAITDGRDCDPHSGLGFLERLETEMAQIGVGRVATVVGRYYAMDRDKRWPRTQLAYDALVYGENRQKGGAIGEIGYTTAGSAAEAVTAAYATGRDADTDEFITPRLMVGSDGKVLPRLSDGDSLLFFNFRGDRPRQLLHALHDDGFTAFDRGAKLDLHLATLVQYEAALDLPFAFKRTPPAHLFGQVVAEAGLTQLRAAETEKYAHVTFFFNNQIETPFAGEQRILVKSPPVETYDQQPEMSAYRLAGAVADEMHRFDVIVMNFANLDMVGHTGNFEAAIKAVEAVDRCLEVVLGRLAELGGRAIVTADHGNSEEEIDYEKVVRADGTTDYSLRDKHTYHTPWNLTPCVLVDDTQKLALRPDGKLGDVAPTLLKLLGLPQPAEMTGESLI